MLVPEAILQADYAAPLRETLAERFGRTSLIYIRDRLFDGTDEPVVVVACADFGGQGHVTEEAIECVEDLEAVLADANGRGRLPSSAGVRGQWAGAEALELLSGIEGRRRVSRLSEFATVRVGLVTVDTHLFRELGELLVGRDSTALIELIKNSYDADAAEVIVHGENLDDPDRGQIIVTDTGCGMTREQFIAGFLRVASRLKEQGARRSTVFGRRYTGVKGIGRLAAHKLARKLDVESIHAGSSEGGERTALHAVIDWENRRGRSPVIGVRNHQGGCGPIRCKRPAARQTEIG